MNIPLTVFCSGSYRVENIFILVATLAIDSFLFQHPLSLSAFVTENIAMIYIYFYRW